MKKYLIAFAVVGTLVFSAVIMAQSFWGGKTMSANQVRKKWGSDPVDMKKFKDGDISIKAKMAYSIMMDGSLIGKSGSYIRENLGDPDGFYFIDSYPAYIIQAGKDRTEETWQIVFKMNSKYEVRDIIMHKNCCEN